MSRYCYKRSYIRFCNIFSTPKMYTIHNVFAIQCKRKTIFKQNKLISRKNKVLLESCLAYILCRRYNLSHNQRFRAPNFFGDFWLYAPSARRKAHKTHGERSPQNPTFFPNLISARA